jgi:hypothetical protein
MAFVINSYENSHLALRIYHNRFSFAPSRDSSAGKSLPRQIQNGIRGQGYNHARIIPLHAGADPAIVGFYKMMQSSDAGEKVSKIELIDLTPEDVKKAATPMDSPTGGKVCLTLKPTKKLIIAGPCK